MKYITALILVFVCCMVGAIAHERDMLKEYESTGYFGQSGWTIFIDSDGIIKSK